MEMQAYEEVEDEPELPNQVRMTQNQPRERAGKGMYRSTAKSNRKDKIMIFK